MTHGNKLSVMLGDKKFNLFCNAKDRHALRDPQSSLKLPDNKENLPSCKLPQKNTTLLDYIMTK